MTRRGDSPSDATNSAPFATTRVGDVDFQVCRLQDATRWLLREASEGTHGHNVRLANAYNVALCHQDEKYRELIVNDGINFPDGTPIVWAMNARRSGLRAERVRGPSLFVDALATSTPEIRHFFLGSTPAVLSDLEASVRHRFPNAHIAGLYSPPFAPVDAHFIADCANQIRKTNANLVWVGLGTPKQDFVGTRLAQQSEIITVNVGAAFDFVAGSVQEAPVWVQRSGFEWFYRLLREPKRLWKRYLFGNMRFLVAVTLPNGGRKRRR